MASASSLYPYPNLIKNDVVSFPKIPFFSFHYKSSLFGSKFSNKLWFSLTEKTRSDRSKPLSSSISGSSSSHTFDVVIIGAGIIGLAVARQFLTGSDLSVAVVDKAVPCSGATGAGQGYIWMAHKTPGSEIWELALRSHQLWRMLAECLPEQGMDPQEQLGWKETGSLLIGRTPEELDALQRRVKLLKDAGLRAEYLSASDLHVKEPALIVENDSGAAFLPDDFKLDAQLTVDFILKGNRHFSSEGRYAEFFNDPVTSLLRSSNGEVVGVKAANNTLYGRKAIVVAAGCWSGSLMQELFKEAEFVLEVPVKPRKGHLLVLKNFNFLQLNHAQMEVGYVDHQNATSLPNILTSEVSDDGETLSVSMTATMDTMGNLVLGSSRQFAGFSTEVEESVIDGIWNRAKEFFPILRDRSLSEFTKSREVRVGLRPYMPDGKPIIGPVPGLSNVLLATGHEGGGIAMALGTAEMIADMVLGKPEKINYAPFAVQGRCVEKK
ncbi:hypothetical protein UlMin_031968 [Ulmus minor]